MKAMKFSSIFIENVRTSNNIIDIIENHTELRPTGNGYMGLCPFPGHNEKTPSFSVSEERQVYHCFGCKKAGNLYHFVEEIQGMGFLEAVEYLAHRAGIPLPKEAQTYSEHGGSGSSANEKKQAYEVNKLAAEFFHKNLLSLSKDHSVQQYALRRGLSEEIIKKFCIGYAPARWEALGPHLAKRNLSTKIACSLGLLKKRNRDKGQEGLYDLFRDRLIFPIVDRAGRYVGFGGRILGDGQPKYLNSPESLIFHKGKILYGLNTSAKYILAASYAIVVEGYMDFIALQKAGIKNVVATLGTALTANHCHQLQKVTQKVVLLFDGDSAGQDASQRSLPILLENKLHPRICVLNDGQDPDTFLESEGADALRLALRGARDLFIYHLERIIEEIGMKEASDKVLVLDKLASNYTRVVDMRLKELYVTEISRRLNAEKFWVQKGLREKLREQELKEKNKKGGATRTKKSEVQVMSPPHGGINHGGISHEDIKKNTKVYALRGGPKEEAYLLNLALMDEKYLLELREKEVVERFSHSGIREILGRVIFEHRQDSNNFGRLTALLSSQVDYPQLMTLYLERPISELDDEGRDQLFEDCLRRVCEKHMKSQIKELSFRLRSKTTTEQQLQQLEQIMLIHKDKHNLKKSLDPSK